MTQPNYNGGPVNPGRPRREPKKPYTTRGGWKNGFPFPRVAYLYERVSKRTGQTFLMGRLGINCWLTVFKIPRKQYRDADFILCLAGPAMDGPLKKAYEGQPPKKEKSIAHQWKEKQEKKSQQGTKGGHDDDAIRDWYGVDEIQW